MTSQNIGHHLSYWMINMKEVKKNNWTARPFTIIWVSLLSSILILVICYLQNNIAYAFFDDINHFSKLEYIKRQLSNSQRNDSDVLYINIAYDKKLISYNDPDYGFPEGVIDITDRSKLYQFLDIAKKANNYNYIFLDVRFEKGYEDNDSLGEEKIDNALYKVIASTPRIVVSNHNDIIIADSSILPKTALNDYFTTITATNLVRYQYLRGESESVALRMYKDLYGKSISKHGPFYTSEGKLCYNCPFLRIANEFPARYDDEGNANYYNLGVDLLDVYSEKEIADIIKNKTILIGDLIEDVHDTYVGMLPGCFITYNAFKSLVNGKHLVNWSFMWISFILYFIISISMFSRKRVVEYLPIIRSHQSGIVHFIITLLSYAAVMLIVSDLLYFICNETSSIWFPSVYFSLVSTILNYIKR